MTGSVATATALQPAASPPVLSLEEVVRRTKPSVVRLIETEHTGSGFFITETGVIATNAHVARGEGNVTVHLANGTNLPAKVVYVDRNRDLALVKVTPPRGFAFPRLPLADLSLVHQGKPVVAIGNPAESLNFSAVKGIVSAIGPVTAFGTGTWIQTDAPINPGNSGGPLLNARSQVIGLNALKVQVKGINNISYALSAADLLKVLRRFYPDLAPTAALRAANGSSEMAPDSAKPATSNSAAPGPSESSASASSNSSPPVTSAPLGSGVLAITSEPDSTEIYVDGKFHGTAPATLKLPAGSHTILLKSSGLPDYARIIEVPASSKLTLKATLTKSDGQSVVPSIAALVSLC